MVGVGLLVRRLSVPIAAVSLAALVLTGAASAAGGGGGPAWLLLLPLAVLFAARLLAVSLGALGWLIFPSEHRAVLSELATAPQPDGG